VHRAWPLVDVVSGEVLQAGLPYGQAEGTLGPRPAPVITFERDPSPLAEIPSMAPPTPVEAEAAPPAEPPAAPGLLPQPPASNPALAGLWLLIALLTTAFARTAPRWVSTLRGAGLLPALLRTGGLTARVVAAVAWGLTVVYGLPQGARPLVSWIAVGLALALGFASWALFRDVLALGVLRLEGRLVQGRHVQVGTLSGQVVSQSPRAVTLQTADGAEITVPNWRFLSDAVHLDDDPRARVAFRLRVPAEAPRERVHRVLEELVLLSPYAVTSGRPGVRPDPDDPSAWWVDARLLDARWAQAFERTLVELAVERLQT